MPENLRALKTGARKRENTEAERSCHVGTLEPKNPRPSRTVRSNVAAVEVGVLPAAASQRLVFLGGKMEEIALSRSMSMRSYVNPQKVETSKLCGCGFYALLLCFS